jgi:hypothetical protein
MPSSLNSGSRHFIVSWNNPSAAYAIDRTIFTAPYDCTVQSISEVHSVVGSHGSDVNVQITKDTGTTAPGAGTDLLSNNSDAGFNLKSTINTVVYGAFKAGASRKLAKGDRLSLDFAGTQTAVEGLNITIVLNRLD